MKPVEDQVDGRLWRPRENCGKLVDRHAALQGLGEVLKKPYLPSLVMFYVDDFLIWFDCAETDVQSGIKDSPKP